jgi:hypothetical protein
MAQEREPQPDQEKEIPFKEAVQRADKAIDKLYGDLGNLAREDAKTDPSLTPEYVENKLKQRDADTAGRDRLRTHFLEMMSREQTFTFEGKQPAVPEKPVQPSVKERAGNVLRNVGAKINKVFPRK